MIRYIKLPMLFHKRDFTHGYVSVEDAVRSGDNPVFIQNCSTTEMTSRLQTDDPVPTVRHNLNVFMIKSFTNRRSFGTFKLKFKELVVILYLHAANNTSSCSKVAGTCDTFGNETFRTIVGSGSSSGSCCSSGRPNRGSNDRFDPVNVFVDLQSKSLS